MTAKASTPASSAAPTCSAFFQAKIAFEIPGHYGRDGIYGREYNDKMVERLMALFEDTEFETENLCSPALLIVNTHETPSAEWIAKAIERINGVLQNAELCGESASLQE